MAYYISLQKETLTSQCMCAAVFGISSHLLYYIRGRRDRQALSIIIYHILLGSASLGIQISNSNITSGFLRHVFVSASYLTALFASTTFYRLFFHRLRYYPGPLAAKITNLYAPFLNKDGKMHEERLRLFKEYGDFVRIGMLHLLSINLLLT